MPVAVPPLMTSRSDGEPSAPRNVFIAIVPPVPRVAARRQDRARSSAGAHVHQAGIRQVKKSLIEPVEIECSAVRHRHGRIRAERVGRACLQHTAVDVGRSAIGVNSRKDGGAGEHVDRARAADRRRKHIVG